jgi:hypothetical protein
MLFLRPLSILGVRLPQLIGWVYDPKDLVEPFLPKEKQKEYLIMIQRSNYIPPKYQPSQKIELRG